MSRNGYTQLDAYVSAEIRSDIARAKGASVKGIAERIGVRRATLSARVNAQAAFTPSLLAAVAAELGTSASDVLARAEREMEREAALAVEGRQSA